MANVHRLGDYNNPNPNNQNGNYGDDRADNAFVNHPLLGGRQQQQNQQFIDPRKENIFHMVKFTFCPTFTVRSFIFFITLIDILVYITTLIVSSASYGGLGNYTFLAPKQDVLQDFGALYPIKIKCQGQLQRLIFPLFLHDGFLHIFSNLIPQMIIGFLLESFMGPLKVAAIYIISGIGGNIFSALCAPDKGQPYVYFTVGSTTSIYGLVSTIVALLVVNWKAMDTQPQARCFLMIIVIFILLFSVLASLTNTSYQDPSIKTNTYIAMQVDIYGCLGALMTGFLFSSILMQRFRGAEALRAGSYESKIKIFGMGGLAFCFILFFTLFFALNKPRC